MNPREREPALQIASILSSDGLAYPIDRDNRRFGRPLEIGEAHRQGIAYYVLPGPSFFVLDVDREDGIEVAEEFALKHRCKRPVVVASGGDGRAHVFIRVGEAKARMRLFDEASRIQGAEVRKGCKGIRPPLSPHRTGAIGRIVSVSGAPGTAQDALEALTAAPPKERTRAGVALEDGWPRGQRSSGLFWLASEYQRQGLPFERYRDDVLAHPHGAGEKLYERSSESREKWLRGAWSRSSASVKVSRTKVENWHRAARAFLREHRGPKGRKGSIGNAEAVVRVLADAFLRGGGVGSDSLRQMAEKTGCTFPSVKRWIGVLVQGGLLERDGSDRQGQRAFSNCYRPICPPCWSVSTHPPSTPPPPPELGVYQNAPFLPRHVLDALWGRSSLKRVVVCLLSQDHSIHSLEASLGVCQRSVRSALRQLEAFGLVVRSGKTYRLVPLEVKRVWVECALKRGTHGSMDRMVQRHGLERDGYLAYLQRCGLSNVDAMIAKRRMATASALRGFRLRVRDRSPRTTEEVGFPRRL